MNLRSLMNDRGATVRIGSAFLILASAVRWFVHPSAALFPGVLDAATGLLYGVSIACLLRSLMLNRRG